MSGISIRQLTVSYGQEKVLDNLNLEVGIGEFIVLLGPSGCGKSTLLNTVAGLLDASGGQIIIGDRNVTWEEPKDRGIGMVFQSYALYPQMTVRGNLEFGLKNAGTTRGEIDRRVKRASEMLQIEPYLKRKPAALSGGQRQRVAIGRALVRDAGVFLFDEPLSNLDAKLRAELRVEIKRLHQKLENNSMVYVTHDQIEALTLADRIAVMRSGVIEQLDDPHTIYNRPNNMYVAGFIGSPSMNFIKGKVIHDNGHKFDFGAKLVDLEKYQATDKLATASDALLGVRPEHVLLNSSGVGIPMGDGEVEIIEPMGSDSLIWLRIAGISVSARVDGNTKFTIGDAVKVTTEIELASVFDKESEGRL